METRCGRRPGLACCLVSFRPRLLPLQPQSLGMLICDTAAPVTSAGKLNQEVLLASHSRNPPPRPTGLRVVEMGWRGGRQALAGSCGGACEALGDTFSTVPAGEGFLRRNWAETDEEMGLSLSCSPKQPSHSPEHLLHFLGPQFSCLKMLRADPDLPTLPAHVGTWQGHSLAVLCQCRCDVHGCGAEWQPLAPLSSASSFPSPYREVFLPERDRSHGWRALLCSHFMYDAR